MWALNFIQLNLVLGYCYKEFTLTLGLVCTAPSLTKLHTNGSSEVATPYKASSGATLHKCASPLGLQCVELRQSLDVAIMRALECSRAP